jgi:hypothetical protein
MATTVSKISNSNNILSGSSSQLVTTKNMVRNFGSPEDYVELHIADPAGKILYSISPFTNYQIPGNFQTTTTIQDLVFDPATDLKNIGIQYGDYNLTYNVLRPKIVKSNIKVFFIKEISGNRTELRLITNNVSNIDVENGTNDFINEIQSLSYFKEFYLNFGNNKLVPVVNIALDKSTNPYSVLVKLLNPLPINYNVNDTLLIVDEISNPQVFDVNVVQDPTPVVYPTLRGPNFDLDLDQLRVGPTPYYNFNQITTFSGSFNPQLQQLLGQLSASNFAINVDYTDYENFVHFSSAARRLEGFKYKLSNIEQYTAASASAAASTSPTAQLDAKSYQAKINTTIQSFDGWEQYLYFESSSYTWPKTNSVKPYINASTSSVAGTNWYNGNHDSASLYDDNNQNYMLYTLPGYIAENNDNELAFKFVASIGQMFDDIWIHIKAITDLYQAKNSLTEGISKDLVYFALQSMGFNAYTDQDGNNQFQYLYGVNENGSYKPITGSYETLVSASNYQLSGQDQQKGIYKRLYSNLPLLLKSKGTTRFIQYLNTIFGIPDTIMNYTEYGGVDKLTSSFEYSYDRFTYALQSSGSNRITIPWNYTSQSKARTGYNDIVPNGIEFRFKAYPTASNPATQSLFYSGSDIQFNLLYRSTGSSNSIYSGSVGNFGYFQFKLGGLSVTSSTVPIYNTGSNSDSDNDTDWYSVLVQRTKPDLRIGDVSTSQTYTFYVKNNVWGEVGHVTSASLTTATAATNSLWYRQGAMTFLSGSNPFSGSIQEIRLWSNYVSESTFDSHVLNPESIEGNYTSSAYDDLAARWTLGNNLYTSNHSIVTTTASTAPDQTIQGWTASFANFPNRNNYSSFTETYYADVANSGFANPVTDKIRIISGSTYGTQLLPNKSIEITPTVPLTKDIHFLDASLSPQDEIDRDIIAQLGSTYDIDNIIGDPTGNGYLELEKLRESYFKKYTKRNNYKDYIRLIDFFHNSLFRTLGDFTPARTDLATGIIIRPNLLERSKYEIGDPEVDSNNNLTGSVDLLAITGSNGGDYTQPTYSYVLNTNVGHIPLISDSRDFFYGELPSASINVHTTASNPFIYFNSQNTSSYSESIWNVNYNPILNNVELNQTSSVRYKLTLIGGNAGFVSGSQYVSESIQLQDFTYNYKRHINGRYLGSKTTSQTYNAYSSGDLTFGKSAAIDTNTSRFAFFSEAFATGSDLIAMPERTNLYIRYLIDVSGSLTELTKRNYATLRENQKTNLYEVQRIFKSGEVINVGLFDNQNPSKQTDLDGNKFIFQGGFKFEPVLWKQYDGIPLTYTVSPSVAAASSNGYNIQVTNVNYQNYSNPNNYGGGSSYAVITFNISNSATLTTNGNAIITLTFNLDIYGLGPLVYSTNITLPQGQTFVNESLVVNYELTAVNGVNVTNVNAPSGTPSQFIYNILNRLDDAPNLKKHSDTVISCSYSQSMFFGNFDYYSYDGVQNPQTFVTNSIDYSFDLNPGDVVRFATPGSTPTVFLYPQFEYTIMSVDKPLSFPNEGANFKHVTFTIDRPLDSTLAYTNGEIPLYVFSRKIANETNIVIQHTKLPGETSGGIAKNTNLAVDIDNQVANITGELKSKIFSTVLTP